MKNRRTIKTAARFFALSLSLAMIFSFEGCKKEKTRLPDLKIPDKKTAVLVAPETQFPEEYRAAAELAREYGGAVETFQYADSRILRPGNPDIMTISISLAKNPEIGAIIYDRATRFANYAISAAKKINPSLIFICVEPEESVEQISRASNFVVCVDWRAAASDIVSAAEKRDAEYFVMFSPLRHSADNPLVAAEAEAFKAACEAKKIKFILKNSYDPNFSGGINKANSTVKEIVETLYAEETVKGENVVLFSTDNSVQPTILDFAKSKGLIYLCPSFPTAYETIGESYKVALPEKISDVGSYIKQIKAAVKADPASKAQISLYRFPLAYVTLRGALRVAFDYLNGDVNPDNFVDRTARAFKDAADDSKFVISPYPDSKLKNVFAVYRPGFEKIS